jgi:hypothetical protein
VIALTVPGFTYPHAQNTHHFFSFFANLPLPLTNLVRGEALKIAGAPRNRDDCHRHKFICIFFAAQPRSLIAT